MSHQTERKRINWMEGIEKAGAQNETATCTLLFVCARQGTVIFCFCLFYLTHLSLFFFSCNEVSKLCLSLLCGKTYDICIHVHMHAAIQGY